MWSKSPRHRTLPAQRFLDRFPNGLGQENQHVLSLAFLKLREVLKTKARSTDPNMTLKLRGAYGSKKGTRLERS